jgi:hypothetical protein
MVKKCILMSLLFALALSSTCCTKLPARFVATGPAVPVSVMPVISLESGDLIAVTPHPLDAHWVALWFQKADKTISVRWVNISSGNIGGEITIPRK